MFLDPPIEFARAYYYTLFHDWVAIAADLPRLRSSPYGGETIYTEYQVLTNLSYCIQALRSTCYVQRHANSDIRSVPCIHCH